MENQMLMLVSHAYAKRAQLRHAQSTIVQPWTRITRARASPVTRRVWVRVAMGARASPLRAPPARFRRQISRHESLRRNISKRGGTVAGGASTAHLRSAVRPQARACSSWRKKQ